MPSKENLILIAVGAVAGYFLAGTLAQYPPFSQAAMVGINFGSK